MPKYFEQYHECASILSNLLCNFHLTISKSIKSQVLSVVKTKLPVNTTFFVIFMTARRRNLGVIVQNSLNENLIELFQRYVFL